MALAGILVLKSGLFFQKRLSKNSKCLDFWAANRLLKDSYFLHPFAALSEPSSWWTCSLLLIFVLGEQRNQGLSWVTLGPLDHEQHRSWRTCYLQESDRDSVNDDCEADAINPHKEEEWNDVIFAFIAAGEDDTDATRSGRAITKRDDFHSFEMKSDLQRFHIKIIYMY